MSQMNSCSSECSLSLAQGKNALAGAAGAATGEVVGMIATEMCGISPGTVTCKR